MAERKPTDWEAIEREYRAGQLSVSEIGRQYGVSHTAINKKAKSQGWTRNLAERVREEVSARLVSDGVSAANARETVELAAARGVEIVRSHRQDIASGRKMVSLLMKELETATVHIDDIEEVIEEETADDSNGKRRAMMQMAVALPSRAKTIASLSMAMKNLIGLERQAFNLSDGPDDEKKGVTINVVKRG
ncbi:hypothetical protein [Azospirillum sp. sgz302134]